MRCLISIFSLIYVYTIHHSGLFHTPKNYKNLRTNFKTRNPSRLELSNKYKEIAEILKKKLKNLDPAVYTMPPDEPRGCLKIEEDQPREQHQRNDEDLYIQINDVPHNDQIILSVEIQAKANIYCNDIIIIYKIKK